MFLFAINYSIIFINNNRKTNIGVVCSGCCWSVVVVGCWLLLFFRSATAGMRMRLHARQICQIDWQTTGHTLARTHDCRKQGRAFDECAHLEGEEQQEGHHKTEQTHSLRQGEAQNGVGEQLLFQRWVPGVTDDEGTEYCSDTSTCCIGSLSLSEREKKVIEALVNCLKLDVNNERWSSSKAEAPGCAYASFLGSSKHKHSSPEVSPEPFASLSPVKSVTD